ncbi:hypothetical protein [Anaerococcus cruorum]|uniref:Uncharacterized protein n=1 Tax=Anaerococcus cruorum TaxID=3115617 RepID=A0ABW9MTX6_9FIRM
MKYLVYYIYPLISIFVKDVSLLVFYLNGRITDPLAALRVIVLGFGFVLVFMIYVMAAVGNV